MDNFTEMCYAKRQNSITLSFSLSYVSHLYLSQWVVTAKNDKFSQPKVWLVYFFCAYTNDETARKKIRKESHWLISLIMMREADKIIY